MFRRFLTTERPAIRYVSVRYWLYLIHLPLVIALQMTVRDWPQTALVKFLLINVASMSLLLVSYQLCVCGTRRSACS